MARLGIDFGTTNTVVVLSDRGHFPVVPHRVSTAAGEIIEEVFPSVVWLDSRKGEWRFGLEADRRARREPESWVCTERQKTSWSSPMVRSWSLENLLGRMKSNDRTCGSARSSRIATGSTSPLDIAFRSASISLWERTSGTPLSSAGLPDS